MEFPKSEANQVLRRDLDCKYLPFEHTFSISLSLYSYRTQPPTVSRKFITLILYREDGSIDHSNSTPRAAPGTAAHKLGPKANQGAINAGLRALDRSGKPCRKWTKGGFKLKSFTGVVWEIPRWKAPPKATVKLEASSQGSPSGDSGKENKDNSQVQSEKSNTGPEVEKAGVTTSHNISSPAPSIAPTAPLPATDPIPSATPETPLDVASGV